MSITHFSARTKGLFLYSIDLLLWLALAAAMIIHWNFTLQVVETSRNMTAEGGTISYSIDIMNDLAWYMLIAIAAIQVIIMVATKTKPGQLMKETFDEQDERDIVLKNKWYRNLELINYAFFGLLTACIAVLPNTKIPSYLVGIVLCAYFVIRDTILMIHLIRRTR